MELRERLERFHDTDLYVVITEDFCTPRSATDVLDACLDAGVGIVQLREKEADDRSLYERALAFRERTLAANALLIIDDRVDIALAVEADGVHLGRSDLPIDLARWLAPQRIVGASSHSIEQALEAQDAGAGYVNIGPIFATQTKTGTADPVGPELIEVIAPQLAIPFTCMGGIKRDNIHEVLERGARHVAVVTAVTAADDPRAAAQALREACTEYRLRAASSGEGAA